MFASILGQNKHRYGSTGGSTSPCHLTVIAGNARVFGFEEDLGLTGNDFANISSFFFVTYVIFEVPWVLAVKKWGANSVMAAAIVSWSTITLVSGRAARSDYGPTCERYRLTIIGHRLRPQLRAVRCAEVSFGSS